MTPQKFKDSWTNIDHPLSPLTPERLKRFNLSKSTFGFLSIAGLPTYCQPHLSFAKNIDDKFYGINKLNEVYDLFDRKTEFEKFVIIGSCHDGNVIAINTDKNDQVEELEHEDFFSSTFFNSSINLLADFLILYRDFENAVWIGKDPKDNMQFFNFTDSQFETLREIMLHLDEKAVITDGFWKAELECLLTIRQEHFGNT
jgi:hypothetical protein